MSLEISFLVFLCVSDSRIFSREVSESRIFVFLANGYYQSHDKIVYLIKTYGSSLLNM